MGLPVYILGKFRETALCRDAQHGSGVCCASHHSLNKYFENNGGRPPSSSRSSKTLIPIESPPHMQLHISQ